MADRRLGYNEFKEELKRQVEERVGDGVEVCFHTSVKNNVTEKEAITFQEEGVNMMPMIYLKELYQQYWRDGELEEQVTLVMEAFDTRGNYVVGASLETWDAVKEKIGLNLINYEWNEEFLRKVPHKRMLDLAIVLRIRFWETEYGSMAVTVTDEMVKIWGITEEEAWEKAEENLYKTEYIIRDLKEILCEAKGEEYIPEKIAMQYVMSNEEHCEGSSGILQEGLLQSFAERIHQSFYIVPISIQEVIFTPENCGMEKSYLEEILKELNDEKENEEERLSDRVYYYDRRAGRIKM